MIVIHKFTDANIPPGVKMNAYGSALAGEHAFESLKKKFTPFDGAHAGNASTDDPEFKKTGTKSFFVKFIGDLLDVALHENRVVTEEVSLLCNSLTARCLKIAKTSTDALSARRCLSQKANSELADLFTKKSSHARYATLMIPEVKRSRKITVKARITRIRSPKRTRNQVRYSPV
jgi:hypothetical protein